MNRTQLKDELSVFVDQLRNDEKAKNTVHAYKRNIEMFIESIKHDNPVTIEKRCNHSTKYVEAYVFRNIEEKGNTLITKKKFKGREAHILNDLREFGYECSVRELKDGSYILEGRKINA